MIDLIGYEKVFKDYSIEELLEERKKLIEKIYEYEKNLFAKKDLEL